MRLAIVLLFMIVAFISLLMAGMLTVIFLTFLTEVTEMACNRIHKFFKEERE